MKKLLILTLILIVISQCVNATLGNNTDYTEYKGDSVFVVGVEWQKIANTVSDYWAYITLDLNYNQYVNPLGRYQIVDQYNFSNWWSDNVDFSNGLNGNLKYATLPDGTYYAYLDLQYYVELPDSTTDICSGLTQVQIIAQNLKCGSDAPYIRQGYYGLPFYIEYLGFKCDNTAGSYDLMKVPDLTEVDKMALIRPNYEGLPHVRQPFDGVNTKIPLGFGTYAGQVVRYNSLPVKCKNMVNISKSVLTYSLKPNPLYRNCNPNTNGCETWDYSDIINSMSSISNKNSLPFTMNINFNFSGNFWDYQLSNESYNATYNLYFNGIDGDMDCTIDCSTVDQLSDAVKSWFGTNGICKNPTFDTDTGTYYAKLKSSELTSLQASYINSGKGIQCVFPQSQIVQTLNDKGGEDVKEVLSMQQQKEIALQLDGINQKIQLKTFMADTIIPAFLTIMILLFYGIELFLLGFTIFGLLPMMYNNFIAGLKDAFNIDELIRLENNKRKGGGQ